jgi:hypothetical protein
MQKNRSRNLHRDPLSLLLNNKLCVNRIKVLRQAKSYQDPAEQRSSRIEDIPVPISQFVVLLCT